MIRFSKRAWADYVYWQITDKKKLERINNLIKDCIRNPFNGIGKPEALKGSLAGLWSRRIDDEHRLLYRYGKGEMEVISCRFHYDDVQ